VIAEEHKDEVRPIKPCSTTSNEWYSKKWNAPHACGALDGKRVAVRCPANTGCLWLLVPQLQGFFSMLLLVDVHKTFLSVVDWPYNHRCLGPWSCQF